MAMNQTYLNAVADAGAALITHIGLVNGSGVEISGGTPAYARQLLLGPRPRAEWSDRMRT